MDIDVELKSIFLELFDINEQQYHPKLSRDEVAKWDSLAQLQLVVALEERFSIRLVLDEIVELISVPAIRKMLSVKIAQ